MSRLFKRLDTKLDQYLSGESLGRDAFWTIAVWCALVIATIAAVALH